MDGLPDVAGEHRVALAQQICHLAKQDSEAAASPVRSGGVLYAPEDFDASSDSDFELLHDRRRGMFVGFDAHPRVEPPLLGPVPPELNTQDSSLGFERDGVRYTRTGGSVVGVPMAVWVEERPGVPTPIRYTLVAGEYDSPEDLVPVVRGIERPAGTVIRLP